ncbi:ferritin family protein [candidate division WOR-3 bacterium]|nr:ferritin family protein [candidate division WOR-3 bacterium]
MNREKYILILKKAIKNEIEAYIFYDSVAKKVKEESMKSLFSDLAQEEKNHRTLLESYLENPSKPLVFQEGQDYKVSESVDLPPLTSDMSPAEAVSLAMKKEEEAMKTYEQFADLSKDEEQAGIFRNLANMEKGHKAKLEGMYTNMAFPEAW